MKLKRSIKFFCVTIIVLVILSSPVGVHAQDYKNSFITIVNPVRISSYTENPALSLQSEYEQILKQELPATWLLTYDAISNSSLFKVISSMDAKQEFGIFLEVTENFSSASHVSYNKTNSWHHANSLFLSGYKQTDRKKLIDKVFAEFKSKFGYYPKSVGGWWVDSFSLSYMKDKYGITGILGISDQFDLDNYQVWGTPYSIPYYPSKIHAGIPGDSSNKLDVVTFRWAARDPLNGYISPSVKQASLYSVQDYPQVGVSDPDMYFEKLIELYSVQNNYNQFGHVAIGLEADFPPHIYEAVLANRLNRVKKLEDRVSFLTMKDFSNWYRESFKQMPPHFIETDDFLGQSKKSMWYQSNFYRVGLVYDYKEKKLQIISLHSYLRNFREPFYLSPNDQFNLSINSPYIIDFLNDKNSIREYSVGNLESVSRKEKDIRINFEKGSVILREDEIISDKMPISYNLKSARFQVPQEGLIITDVLLKVPFAIQHRFEKYKIIIVLFTLVLGLFFVKIITRNKWLLFPSLSILLLIIGGYYILQVNTKYYISQTEADGLGVLGRLPKGTVLAYSKDCIRCNFATPYKPAAAKGIKSYVERISGQKTIIDFSFLTAKTSQEAQGILSSKDIRYVYLAKYENYIESLPYLPQDLDLSKVYENANVEIWKVN